MNGLLILALLFGIFWFVLVRPQRARAREQQELIASLEPGDEIVTTGGLYGVITAVDGEILRVEIADGLIVRTARNAVAGIVEFDEEGVEEEGGEEETADGAPEAEEAPATRVEETTAEPQPKTE
jgi:preprotein translocase subunit YajC